RPVPALGEDESYSLEIDAEGGRLQAPTSLGVLRGLETFGPLLRKEGSGLIVPGVRIDDQPRFPWRGLLLDGARHFMPIEVVKRTLDGMAAVKLNVLHWHLTEDQGWRIEILKYPRLTSVGSCRRETMVEKKFDPYVGDSTRYCGFYTQAEIRDVVAYARSRYVTVVPEIEMPGHSKAALAAYPELACTPGPFEVRTTWGVDEDIFCPSEETFAFLEGVLTEVIGLFPGTYIHIGGDEAPRTRWRASPLAQEVIRREGLRDEHELQSWFIRRIERFLLANGRRLIGWDEILEGGLAPEATVMSWRGTSGGIEAARQGHDVIMTPTSHLYFDYYQGEERFEPLANGGLLPLDRVYAFEPVPDSLTPEQAQHILGAQGNVWTEYLKTPAAVEYMAYPRTLALAEVAWSPREARSWQSFIARLPFALRALDKAGVAYRVPHVEGLEADRLTLTDRVTIRLQTLMPDAEIRYTTDGSDPTRASTPYRRPFALPVNAAGVRVTARAFTKDGRVSAPRAATFTRTTYREAEPEAPGRATGLRYEYYEDTVRRAAAIDRGQPVRTGVVDAIARRGDERPEQYALRLSGWLRVPGDALYEFALSSDDGSTLQIGDRIVVDNDGFHGVEERTGMIALRAGLHAITVRFFQGGGGHDLSLRYRVGAGAWAPVPAEWLVRRP
ncbi:MAG TPA: family 20 glycosylhydrolase, partial [Gemmatimonadaceae bacterium]|nr:family 20 glycosylhydrolase [Gemmatimonadaceae bacterium]